MVPPPMDVHQGLNGDFHFVVRPLTWAEGSADV